MISELGKDFKGRELNEDTLDCDQLIVYKGKLFFSGNRKSTLVELWNLSVSDGGKFLRTVSMDKIQLYKP